MPNYETSNKNLFLEKFGYHPTDVNFNESNLVKKLQNNFVDSIQVVTLEKRYKIIASSGQTIDIDSSTFKDYVASIYVSELALSIRTYILNVEKTPLPENLEAEDLIRGDCQIPERLSSFISAMVCGTAPRYLQSEPYAR